MTDTPPPPCIPHVEPEPPTVLVAPPAFTPEQVSQDGKDRVTRTGGQGGVAVAVVTIAEWVAHQAGWHGQLETPVSGAFVLLLTVAASYVMNRRRIQAT